MSIFNLENFIYQIGVNETLFVVSCTKRKIWDDIIDIPEYADARKAYTGKRFKMWVNWMNKVRLEEKGFNWIVLRGKYGFIEPSHPISRYDILLGDPKYFSISDKSLQHQVKQKRWWRNTEGVIKEIILNQFEIIICVNCEKEYPKKIENCFHSKKIYFFGYFSIFKDRIKTAKTPPRIKW